ncbi:MAG: hypothetical protein IPL99_14735 [Candidatus Competibacteraceae bacterium]|nr:hypothetical protein [Candidatus Competibacteraceae bacterium]
MMNPALRDALLGLLKSVGLQALAVADIEAMMTAYQPQRPAVCCWVFRGIPISVPSSAYASRALICR